jgi:hypothetical protein
MPQSSHRWGTWIQQRGCSAPALPPAPSSGRSSPPFCHQTEVSVRFQLKIKYIKNTTGTANCSIEEPYHFNGYAAPVQERKSCSPGISKKNYLWWYSKRFVVITRQLQAAKCALTSQLFGHIFTLLESLRFPYCSSQCKQTFVWLLCSSMGPCIKNFSFNFL